MAFPWPLAYCRYGHASKDYGLQPLDLPNYPSRNRRWIATIPPLENLPRFQYLIEARLRKYQPGVKDDTVMTHSIHSFRLDRNRQVLRAGQRARQIAGLLGFDRQHQSAISAAVFAIAYKAVVDHKPARMKFLLSENRLVVRCILCSNRKVKRLTHSFRNDRSVSPHSSRPKVDLSSPSFGDLALEPGLMILSFPLPDGSPRLDAADLPWVIREMSRITPLDPLEEFYQLNRELLRLIRLTRTEQTAENRGGHAA